MSNLWIEGFDLQSCFNESVSSEKQETELSKEQTVDNTEALAKLIQESIAQEVLKKTEKSVNKDLAKNYLTQEQADKRMADMRESWSKIQPNERTYRLAKAIEEKNAGALVRAWAKEGRGTYGNEGSLTAFAKHTGVKLLRLGSVARAEAIYDWAGWTQEQRAADKAAQRKEDEDNRLAREAREQLHNDQIVARRAANEVVYFRDSGEEHGIKKYIDDMIAKGFDSLRTAKIGASTKTYLTNSEGVGVEMPAGLLRDYADVAIRRAKNGFVEEPKDDSEIVEIRQTPQAPQQEPEKAQAKEVEPAPVPEGELPTGYLPPDGNVWNDWTQKGLRVEHIDYKPTPRQRVIMNAVARALEAKLYYNDEVTESVARELQYIGPIDDGSVFKTDVYNARKALDAQKSHAQDREIRLAMNLKVGDQLGTLVFSDYKAMTSVKVVRVLEDGMQVVLIGNRGPKSITYQTSPTTVKFAIDRAKDKERRKDSYAEFLAKRKKPEIVEEFALE